jgi:hypothetical protein
MMKEKRLKNKSMIYGNENLFNQHSNESRQRRIPEHSSFLNERNKKLPFEWDNRKILIENIRKLFQSSNQPTTQPSSKHVY